MYVEFKKLSFCNLLSYGASGAEIDFKTGLNTIKAPNGSGKSTILDALTFVLFGKPYRDIKMAELVNSQNQRGMEVTCDFKIGKDNYTIKRGLKPAIFEMQKNGKDLDLLSSKKLNQEEIDKLLGINLRLFKNIVAVAVTNNKPFLSMSIGDKRVLIENIFNIDVLGDMCKEVKKRKTLATTEFNIKQTEFTGVNSQITDNQHYIDKMKEYIASFNEIKDSNLKQLQANISEFKGKISKAEKNLQIAKDKITELTEGVGTLPDTEVYSDITAKLSVAESNKTRLENTLSKLQSSPMCPVCNSPLTEGHAKKHIDELKLELDSIIKEIIPELQKSKQEFIDLKKEYDSKIQFIDTIRDKAKTESMNKENFEYQVQLLESKLTKESEKTCPADLTEYEEKIVTLQEQLNMLQVDLDALSEKIAIDAELINILGDDGMKTYFFKKLTLILNKNVNEYLTKFELKNVVINFDETMQETITKDMLPRSYNSFSGGEKTRIDMSILLSFFDISRLISNWSCNLLFIDEILDGGIDISGIEQFVSTLYNMISTNKKKLGIYIISHKLNEIKVQLSSTIEIKKIHDYSILEVKNE